MELSLEALLMERHRRAYLLILCFLRIVHHIQMEFSVIIEVIDNSRCCDSFERSKCVALEDLTVAPNVMAISASLT